MVVSNCTRVLLHLFVCPTNSRPERTLTGSILGLGTFAGTRYAALYAFSARNKSEVDMAPGDVLDADVNAPSAEGFLAVVTSHGLHGLVPASYVKIAEDHSGAGRDTEHHTRANAAGETAPSQPLAIVRTSYRASSLEKHYRCDAPAHLVAACEQISCEQARTSKRSFSVRVCNSSLTVSLCLVTLHCSFFSRTTNLQSTLRLRCPQHDGA
jgi:hypothetical protein